jgi:3-oxoacyl-[acyl-carrier protein] reductase
VELARQGAHVAIVDLHALDDPGTVRGAVERLGRRCLLIDADVAGTAAAGRVVGEVVSGLGRLDILVCNAGITADAVTWKMAEEEWDRVIEVNLKGAFNYCRAAAQVFRNQKSGKIVNIASINGMRGKFGQGNYAASKGGLIAYSKSLARELGRSNVNVNVVAPGMVRTDMAGRLPAGLLEQAVGETLLGRIAEPEDVAHVVAFLCSERARHITGEVIKVDGGQYL